MIIYPAMDLMGGTVVRLKQGRFDLVTSYESDPLEALRQFAAAGAEWAHVVDLDGARAGAPLQHRLIGELARRAPLPPQVAGGYPQRAHPRPVFDAGGARWAGGRVTAEKR